ncbi:MAG: hypothetical protein J0I54_20735 [Bosea sp.]|uniref:hypothetical protein n=1 Tax=unclassified Bosea (in: a-proteobacteria) TaxID=2653178 RepID=UPI00096613A0|nr:MULTISPECIES: hypothetical protein [unclassified Bosea (in: a-proteobacteria)]MBN9459067.1 hypothetical protein [Bosea sp. (in: a-proteobacteria)]OJV06194.1 MAG: hypothetical protein BGO20_08020 [Bosea sp. 67-29]
MILGRLCPSIEDVRAAVFAYLPRGRAWQTRSGGPHPGSILYGYWSAVADEVKRLYDRGCALELELLCSTAVETKPEWAAEVGLPDGCGVEQDPCPRGHPILGDLCDLLERTAASAGFSIVCSRAAIYCGERVGRARAGRARAGGAGRPRSTLVILVDIAAMEQLPAFRPARSGRYRSGLLRRCGFDVAKLRCVLEPFVPAHAEILIQPTGA